MSTVSPSPVVAILTGMTATGKSALAFEYARKRGNIEIVNADSILVYRGMDIGSAKPSLQEREQIPHHLIDIRDPDQPFNAGDFRREALAAIEAIHSRGRRALIVGGTGFYLKALLYGLWEDFSEPADTGSEAKLNFNRSIEGLGNEELHRRLLDQDPDSAHRIGVKDRYRLTRALELIASTGKTPTELQRAMPSEPDSRFRLLVVDRPKEELERRIRERTEVMLENDLIQEVRALSERFPQARALRSVGYAQVLDHLKGELPRGRKVAPNREGLLSEIELATRQLGKSQRTWFRAERSAQWFELDRERESVMRELNGMYG